MTKKILKTCILFICIILCVIVWYVVTHYTTSEIQEALSALMYKGPVVNVNFNNTIGEIKELNGINNGPKSGNYGQIHEDKWKLDATDIYQELNIPFVRTHDSEYPYGQDKFIDIHCIFPDFTKNVDDPSSYNFVYTDKYVQAILESGAEVFFRLGESIDHSGDNLYITPPSDYEKWAQICEHIIRHYNEGWADGFQYNIQYWEIWNEPENTGKMWTGTMEEFFELYKVTATYLKSVYPDLSIGGYGAANCSEETITAFLQYLKQDGEQVPLDFFSWHTYTADPWEFWTNADIVRTLLDENGYEDTLSILDEWNYVENWSDLTGAEEIIQTYKGASFMTASLIVMQYSSVDGAMYYDGQFVDGEQVWCGLYESGGKLLPGYYVFQFFDQMYQQGKQAEVKGPETGMGDVFCLAASGEKNSILLTNYNAEESVEFGIQFQGDKKNLTMTRINENNPSGIITEKKLLVKKMLLNMGPGETIYIELN